METPLPVAMMTTIWGFNGGVTKCLNSYASPPVSS